MDTPISQSNVSLKLSLIRKRCQELMEEEHLELRLEDAESESTSAGGAYNPYNRSR